MKNNISLLSVNRFLRQVWPALLLWLASGLCAAAADVWDGTIANKAADKLAENGIALRDATKANSADNPYVIKTAGGFAYFAYIVQSRWVGYNAYWALEEDIDLNNIAWSYGQKVGDSKNNTNSAFAGQLDGGGHTVSNVAITSITSGTEHGLLAYVEGTSSSPAVVKNLTIEHVVVNSTGSHSSTTRFGALTGYAKYATLTGITVKDVQVNNLGTVTNEHDFGGVLGCMDTGVKAADVEATGVQMTFGSSTSNLYVGGLVGNVMSSNCSLAACSAADVDLRIEGTSAGMQCGGLLGKINCTASTFSDCSTSKVSMTQVGAVNSISNYGGLAGYVGTSSALTLTGCSASDVDIKLQGATTTVQVGGLVGFAESSATMLALTVSNNETRRVNITCEGSNSSRTYLGGLMGNFKASQYKVGSYVELTGNTATDATIAYNGDVTATDLCAGGLLGFAENGSHLKGNLVVRPKIILGGNLNNRTLVGGAIGGVANYTRVEDLLVQDGSIVGPKETHTTGSAVILCFGGAVGIQWEAGAAAYNSNLLHNVGVDGMTIDLGGYEPASTVTIGNHRMHVGGVVGLSGLPTKDADGVGSTPVNLVSRGVKIYAPYAATSPTVGIFGNNSSNNGFSHERYDYLVSSTVDLVEVSKRGSWLYADYQVGISKAAMTAAEAKGKTMNLSADAVRTQDATDSNVEWLTVNDATFVRNNRRQDTDFNSRTILWWTDIQTSDFTTSTFEQNLYPTNNSTAGALTGDYKYYPYFFQGVNYGKYSADVTYDLASILANCKQMRSSTPIVLTITDLNRGQRGFDAHEFTVKAAQSGADVTRNYSYRWYVDGPQVGTDTTSAKVRPDWRLGRCVQVHAIDADGNVVAMASYALRMGLIHTRNSFEQAASTDSIGMDIAERGTASNPYIIDCAEALRQWSKLSTLSLSTYPEGLTAKQVSTHYNLAYYELSADIDLSEGMTAAEKQASPRAFTPISHTTKSGKCDPNFSAYVQGHIFDGHFDGKGHKISNFSIEWYGGAYKTKDQYQYFGLFGATGNPTMQTKWGDEEASSCVIQNLIVENAHLVHRADNTTFSFDLTNPANTTSATHVFLGVVVGVMGKNTVLQNIDVRSSHITDVDGPAYQMAGMRFSVGGVVGRIQQSFNARKDLDASATLRLVTAECDIDLTQAQFTRDTQDDRSFFMVGGIVGSIYTESQTDEFMVWPSYTFFTGAINAPKAFVGPAFAEVSYSGNTENAYASYCKHYMAKTSSTATRELTAIYYGNGYQINDGTSSHYITNSYPTNTCSYGARTVADHSVHSNYNNGYYQGVNYGTYVESADQSSVEELFIEAQADNAELSPYAFAFDESGCLRLQAEGAVRISLTDAEDDDKSATEHVLVVKNSAGKSGYRYEWYVNERLMDDSDVEQCTFLLGATPQLVYVKVYQTTADGSEKLVKTTSIIDLPRLTDELTADYTPKKEADFETKTITVLINEPFSVDDENFKYDYAWMQWSNGETTEHNYTAEQCLTTNWEYIDRVEKGGVTLDESQWTADIYASTDSYTITYKKRTITITAEDYAQLTVDEKKSYTEQADGTYVSQVEYTPVTTADVYTTTSAGKISLTTEHAADGNVLSGASELTTYYCTVTATDLAWSQFISEHGAEAKYLTFNDRYATQLSTELTIKIETAKKVIYLNPSTGATTISGVTVGEGNDSNDGLSPQTPVKTWKHAYSLLDGAEATWDDNYIVLIGRFSSPGTNTSDTSDPGLSPFNTSGNMSLIGSNGANTTGTYTTWQSDSIKFGLGKNVTITGRYDGVDYGAEYKMQANRRIGLFGNTRFQYMTFSSTHAGYEILMCQYHDLEMGEGLTMKDFSASTTYGKMGGCLSPFFQIFGGFNNDKRFAGNPLNHEQMESAMPEKGFSITIKSGFYAIICAGSRQATSSVNGVQGTPRKPVKCTINIDIDRSWNDAIKQSGDAIVNDKENAKIPYDVVLTLAGNHEGAMYGDVTINVTSGKVGRIVNGTMGAIREISFNYNNKSYRYPLNAFIGRSSIVVDPTASRFYTGGEARSTTDERVLFTEVYGGGLGRSHNSEGMISIPYYGHNSVTINGGTMAIPDGVTASAIICGIYGGGAGGTNGIGISDEINSENEGITRNNLFPYWAVDDSTGVVLYGGWSDYAKATGKQKVYITCRDSEGKVDETIDPQYAQSSITITGGIFGSSGSPITGIFGAGSGLTSTEFLADRDKSTPNAKSGNMYGKQSDVTASLTITGGTIYGNVYGAGRGTDKYYMYNERNSSQWTTLDTTLYKNLAQTYGDVVTSITGGTIYGSVFAGAAGVENERTPDMARVYGNTQLTVSGTARITGSVYGGGENAKTNENTYVNVKGGLIGADDGLSGGNIFGGGLGCLSTGAETIVSSADVGGSTFVTVDGLSYPSATTPYYIYGGGNLACNVAVTANVNINSGIATDQTTVFGGGLGVNATCGATNVNVGRFGASKTSSSLLGLHDLYGGGNEGVVTGLASIRLAGGCIFGSVYGGGNKADVGTAESERPEGAEASDYGTSVSMVDEVNADAEVYGNIYGGGNLAKVYGIASVNISSGNVAGEIYGGGCGALNDDGTVQTSADIVGSTQVVVEGAEAIWDKKWDSNLRQFITWDGTQYDDNFFTTYTHGTSTYPVFNNAHNIYGGGNLACAVEGGTTVSVTHGMAPYELFKTQIWKDAYSDSNHPHFYVFGGGYGLNTTVNSTDVTVNIEGDYGDYSAEVGDDIIQKVSPVRYGSAGASIPVLDNSTGVPGFTVLGVLGGGYAGLVQQDTRVSVDGETFLHRVYGGGYGDPESSADNTSGQVLGSTSVYVNGGYTYGDIFGGGAGVAPASATSDPFTEVARVMGQTYVEIGDDAAVYGSVYGGGDIACVGNTDLEKDYSLMPSSVSTKDPLYGWTYAADASTYRTFVNVVGGDLYGVVYGGGKGLTRAECQRYAELGRIEGNTLVHVANTSTEVMGASLSDDGSEVVPYLWGRVYGGCAYGTVDGNTLVHIEGGMFGRSIFGGGYGDVPIDEGSTDESTLRQVLGRKCAADEVTSADVLGNTRVQIDGGSWLWNRNADSDGNITTWLNASRNVVADQEAFKTLVQSIDDDADLTTIPELQGVDQNFFNFSTRQFVKNHNIFGGGNRACTVGTFKEGTDLLDNTATGTAEVIINHSPLTTVEDGNGGEINVLDVKTEAGLCLYLGMNNTSNPQFSVFGAGYGAGTRVANAVVRAHPSVQLEADGATVLEGAALYRNYESDLEDYCDFESELLADYASVSVDDKKMLYGSLNGDDSDPNTYLRYRAARIAWIVGIPSLTFMNIHGGGYSGYVTGDAYVESDCMLTCRNLFGGGLGAKPYDTTSKTYGTEDFGSVGGNASVLIKSGLILMDAFGGGAGVESILKEDGSDYVDFPLMARVKGHTSVDVYGETVYNTVFGNNMDRTMVIGSIFGGGDVAGVGSADLTDEVLTSVTPTQITEANKEQQTYVSTVNIRGGALFSQVYAGGNGRLNAQCSNATADADYGYTRLGAVYGNCRIVVANADDTYPYTGATKVAPAETIAPNLLNRAYGGCKNGTVYGNTLVDIQGGRITYNIFGGGWGNVDETVDELRSITSADVRGNTNILISGGEAKLTSYWHADPRTWEPATVVSGVSYSPQYNPETQKFKINHNVYGGGNVACVVEGDAYVTMTRGLINASTSTLSGSTGGADYNFFESNEWHEIYKKTGSPHFSLFGGGYGEHTTVSNTHVDISCAELDGNHLSTTVTSTDAYKNFRSAQSVMDIVGGGYSGQVLGQAHVHVGDGTYARSLFGGGFYNQVSNTLVDIEAVDCWDVYGGGLMGDVLRATNVNVGSSDAPNSDIYIRGNIYGGNDVSGYINLVDKQEGEDVEFLDNEEVEPEDGADYQGGTHVNIYGGHIYGNVYGAGNGNFLYALAKNGETSVTVNEDYKLDGSSNVYDLVYTVPMRSTMISPQSAPPAMTIVNINSWRPLTNKVTISLSGSPQSKVHIDGNVFGGGNSATVLTAQDHADSDETVGGVTFHIGNHIDVGGIFLGSDGDQLFINAAENPFLKDFQDINNLSLHDTIDWDNNPGNHGISTAYLPTPLENRPEVYPHLLDLYFQPVEMSVQPKVYWNGSTTGDVEDVTIGTFCCGGNRGNMNVEPTAAGNVIDVTFPRDLVITDKIVGGCNQANYEYEENGEKTTHTGGYLLGSMNSEKPLIALTVPCQFRPTLVTEADGASTPYYKGANVYGGCYESGTIKGDVCIDFQSDMLTGLDATALDASEDVGVAACNVYGAGYGTASYVRGNVEVLFGSKAAVKTSTSANYVFGGGQQGNVVGNSMLRILNGHVNNSVTGGSYAGFLWGSTQVLVGYPSYYIAQRSGVYQLQRADLSADNLARRNSDATNYADDKESEREYTIRRSVCLLKGDVVSTQVVDAIRAYDEANGTTQVTDDAFLHVAESPAKYGLTWDDIDIEISEAVYGGGYSLATGSSVLANNTTVLKYTDDYNIGDASVGYGGNTTMLIADHASATDDDDYTDAEHITISHQEMAEVELPVGSDLFGYYYKQTEALGGNYRYIYQSGTYTYGGTMPEGAVDSKVYEYDGEGGIFGDGHLSYAQGFRNAELTGYGYAAHAPNSAKIVNTFQRMDMLRLTDNCLVLLGARDYATNATNKTPYSIARVGEIQMRSNIDAKKALPAMLTDDTYNTRVRNYMGLSNNIHYVGALVSDVDFDNATDFPWHNAEGSFTWSDANGATSEEHRSYQAVKQHYIDGYYSEAADNVNRGKISEFQKRNNGTARNMIGIASGYALKVQNAQEVYDATTMKVKDELYYGPIVGVVEMSLVDVRQDEGGGYVYADNVHTRTSSSAASAPRTRATADQEEADATADEASTSTTDEDFLQTGGNFVFPYSELEGQYIVDDCFPSGYESARDKNITPEENAEIHYWYVTGYNYYYNAHITGYTYDSSTGAINFDSDNADGLTVLAGLKQGQEVQIYSWKLRSGHPEDTDYACDLETRNYDAEATDASGNLLLTTVTDEEGAVVSSTNAYTLCVGGSNSNTYDKSGVYTTLPLNADLNNVTMSGTLPTLSSGDAKISFRLFDAADNTSSAYFSKHLAEPCYATLILRAPWLEYKDASGQKTEELTIQKGYIGLQYVYVKEDDGTYTVATSMKQGGQYYYLDSGLGTYEAIEGTTLYVKSGDDYEAIGFDEVDLSGNTTRYYVYADRYYTYTIYLTIEYAQGPDVDGSITIGNCALPGEMIKVSSENVKISVDQSMSPNGYYWRIGRLTADGKFMALKKVNDVWENDDTWAYRNHNDDTHNLGYDTYHVGDDDTKTGLFDGCVYNQTENALYIPAYYYMNGYGVQYGFTVNGMDDTFFAVPMQTATEGEGSTARTVVTDTLVVHNYHRMSPHSGQKKVNLHLAEAVARAHEYSTDQALDEPTGVTPFAEPRVYLSDEEDFNAFIAYLDTIGTGRTAEATEVVTEGERFKLGLNWIDVPRYGAGAQFFLLEDLDVPSDFTMKGYADGITFGGTLHGDGHLLKGIAAGSSLFSTQIGNIYNLGLVSGSIAAAVGEEGAYHCCFEYNDGSDTPRKVYHLDGSCDTTYTEDDFAYGRVAYDLNQYYLEARRLVGGLSSGSTKLSQLLTEGFENSELTDDAQNALRYMCDYYANGDYQYARRSDTYTKLTTGVEYVRTGSNDVPGYGTTDTHHDTTHPIDKVRAQGYEAATTTTAASRTGNYLPLFNATAQTEGLDLTEKMNDYLFWGQSLQATTDDYPSAFDSRQVSAMTDRVWRAVAYCGSTVPVAYHYNAHQQDTKSMSTYVHDVATTAVDFTCQVDAANPTTAYTAGQQTVGSGTCYYAPFADQADAYSSFITDDAITRNLLVYTPAATLDDNSVYDVVSDAIAYGESDRESTIRGHHITVNGTAVTTPYLHLVDRADATSPCNDFCVPVAFDVTDRAWYVRQPEVYAESTNSAWEGICLPFTVGKVEASTNGEITHFYGMPTADEEADPATNGHTLHHEYWLRGFTAAHAGTGTQQGSTVGTFCRPGVEATLFNNAAQTAAAISSYTFRTDFFEDTYASRGYDFTAADKAWYASTATHTFADYLPLTSGVPYLVSFPGSRFYEFDLSGQFYQVVSGNVKAQSITYNAYGPARSDEQHAVDKLTIPVTTTMQTTVSTDDALYAHVGTFMATPASYVLNATGTAFNKTTATVFPFRTYMAVSAQDDDLDDTAVNNPGHRIYIGTETLDAEAVGEEPDGDAASSRFKVYTLGPGRIAVESSEATNLAVYTVAGRLCRMLEVRQDFTVYTGFRPGIYVVGGRKLRVE